MASALYGDNPPLTGVPTALANTHWPGASEEQGAADSGHTASAWVTLCGCEQTAVLTKDPSQQELLLGASHRYLAGEE